MIIHHPNMVQSMVEGTLLCSRMPKVTKQAEETPSCFGIFSMIWGHTNYVMGGGEA